jgi:hypothetical protein
VRAPRSLLLLIGGAALVAGAVLAFAPYSDRGLPCERPSEAAFHTGFRPGLRLDLNRGVLRRVPCVSSARWRLGGGVVLMAGGAAALVVWTRQSRLGREAAGTDDDVSGASPPPGDAASDDR